MGELAETFGRRVKALRTLAGMSQAQLAEASHVSEEWVRRIERAAGSPSFDVIESLAFALRVPPAELFAPLLTTRTDDDALAAASALLTVGEREWVLRAVRLALARPGRGAALKVFSKGTLRCNRLQRGSGLRLPPRSGSEHRRCG